jgi:N-acetylneuraminate synthase
MKIDGITLGDTQKPYVIAEMSGNHSNSYSNAEKLLVQCAENGASAFKLQTYTPESMTLNSTRPEYIVNSGPWAGRNLFDLYSEGQTPAKWIPDLFQVAKEVGISIFSSPFSPRDVEILEENSVSAYKVASFEINYTQLLKSIGQTRKPVVFSTGLAKLDEIQYAIDTLTDAGSTEISILKCSTSYPARIESLNLSTIPYLAEKYKVPVGFSDHTIGNNAAICAVAIGATILEKHVKLDEDETSVDASFSLAASNLPLYISAVTEAALSRGSIQDGPTKDEESYLRYRRSIVANRRIEKGEVFTEENLSVVRPDIGLSPSAMDEVINQTTGRTIEFGEGIKFSDLAN